MKKYIFQILRTSPALPPSSSYTSTASYLQHTQQHIHFNLSSQLHLHNLKPFHLFNQPLAMPRSIFQARMAFPYRGPVSPKPMSQLDIARKGLAASPIDRFDPVHHRHHALMQQQAALDHAASIHCPSNMEQVILSQPNLDLGVQLFIHMPTLASIAPVQPVAPVQPIAAGQQTAAAAQPAAQFHHAGPTAPVFQVLPIQLPGPVQQAAPVPPVAPIHPIVAQVVVVHAAPTHNVPILQPAPAPVHHPAPAPVRGHRRNRSSGSNGNRHQRKLSYRRNSPPSAPRPSTTQTRRNHTAANANRELTPEQYNQLADGYMGSILWQLEDAEGMRNDMEVEESVSLLPLSAYSLSSLTSRSSLV